MSKVFSAKLLPNWIKFDKKQGKYILLYKPKCYNIASIIRK